MTCFRVKLYFPDRTDPAVSDEFRSGHFLNKSNAYFFSQVGHYKERSTQSVLLVYALSNLTEEIYSVIVFVISFGGSVTRPTVHSK